MRYAVSRFNQHQRDTAYRIYVSDTLRMIAVNTGNGYQRRWIDIVTAQAPHPDDGKTALQIAMEIPGLGLKEA